jgi:hypothetical protein
MMADHGPCVRRASVASHGAASRLRGDRFRLQRKDRSCKT